MKKILMMILGHFILDYFEQRFPKLKHHHQLNMIILFILELLFHCLLLF